MRWTTHTRRAAGAIVALCLALVAFSGSAAGSGAATSSSTILRVAGTGVSGDTGDGGPATEAAINQPRSIFATPDGGFVWAEPWSNRVRKVWPDGRITTIAGTGSAGYTGDGGPATQAQLNFAHSAAPTPDGGYLVADELNNVIRRISPSGVITTVAGTGSPGYSGDGGPATSAQINNPRGVVALPGGGFLFPDSNNHRVRRVSPDGTISTVAGTGVQGFSGDGGAATSAQLSIPFGVAPTPDGGFLIVDVGNQRVRKVSSTGIIQTVAGTGVAGYSGDGGPATSAQLDNPHNVVALPDGSFLIADASNSRVRLVAASGTISTFAGTGVGGFSGDGGPASAAQLNIPKAVALTSSGDVLIADEQNNRIRFVGTIVAPANVSAPTLSGTPSQGQTLTGSAGGWSGTGPTFAYQWRRCDTGGASCVDVAGATAKTYVVAAADSGATLRMQVTASNPAGSAVATSAQTSVVGAALAPPSNVTPPSVSGTAADGQTLTTSDGTWSGTMPMTFSYQWRRCDSSGGACVPVAGATARTYPVSAVDVGSTLRAAVTASNGAGSSSYASTVTGDLPTSYWRLADTGTVAVDARGFANGSYAGSPQQGAPGLLVGDSNAAVSLNGTSQYVEIPGNSAWTPSAFSIEVLVKPSSLPGNRTIAAVQSASFTGWWLNTDSNGAPRLFVGDGSGWRYAAPGSALPVGGISDLVATYDGSVARLYVDGALVSTGPPAVMSPNLGANPLRLGSASSFAGQYWPGTIDEASFYPVALSAAQVSAHYAATIAQSSSSATSAQTAVVVGTVPANTAPPVISGTAQAGQTLSSTTGSWSGTAPLSYAYQWQRCSPACANVGTNQASYLLGAADVGARLQVVVSATNTAGSASATSAQTQPVTSQPSSGTLTVSLASGSDDGEVDLSGAQAGGYPPSGTASVFNGPTLTAARRLAYGSYGVYVPLLRFDTSTLPAGATVTSATLKLYVNKALSADNRNLVAEWANGATWPLAPSDWTLSSSGSALAGVAVSSLTTGAVNSFSLSGLANVNPAGYTTLRLHLDGGVPSGDNYVQLAAYEDGGAPRAQLVLTWTTP